MTKVSKQLYLHSLHSITLQDHTRMLCKFVPIQVNYVNNIVFQFYE